MPSWHHHAWRRAPEASPTCSGGLSVDLNNQPRHEQKTYTHAQNPGQPNTLTPCSKVLLFGYLTLPQIITLHAQDPPPFDDMGVCHSFVLKPSMRLRNFGVGPPNAFIMLLAFEVRSLVQEGPSETHCLLR